MSTRFEPLGYRIPTMRFPEWFVRLYALVDSNARRVSDELNKEIRFDTTRIREILGWEPRPLETSILEMGESMIEHGVVRPSAK